MKLFHIMTALSPIRRTIIGALFIATILFAPPTIKQAKAYCCGCEICTMTSLDHTLTEMAIQLKLQQEIQATIEWFTQTFWAENIFPGLTVMSLELSTMPFTIQAAVGGMIDGMIQNRAILETQELRAKTTSNQTPSVSVCRYASLSKGLASSNARARLNASILAKRSMDRQVGAKLVDDTGSGDNLQQALDSIVDHNTRYDQFLSTYCDPQDLQNNLGANPNCAGTRKNRDINYNQLVDSPLTLNIDYSNPSVTIDELDVVALQANLFSDELISRNPDQFKDKEEKLEQYMDFRSIMAKRNVAEHSFNTIIGLKSSGSGASNLQMNAVLEEVMPNTAIGQTERLNTLFPDLYGTGTGPNPSYYAQMELLTQKIFQDVSFYANLYDNPVNVDRQYATLQALGLMQRREAFESMVRGELLASILLELEVSREQRENN